MFACSTHAFVVEFSIHRSHTRPRINVSRLGISYSMLVGYTNSNTACKTTSKTKETKRFQFLTILRPLVTPLEAYRQTVSEYQFWLPKTAYLCSTMSAILDISRSMRRHGFRQTRLTVIFHMHLRLPHSQEHPFQTPMDIFSPKVFTLLKNSGSRQQSGSLESTSSVTTPRSQHVKNLTRVSARNSNSG